MKRSRFSEEQIIGVLKELEAGMATAEVPPGKLHELLPWNWKAQRQAETMEMAA